MPPTCLAPDPVEAILDGRQPKGLRLGKMLGNGPLVCEEQRAEWGFAGMRKAHNLNEGGLSQ